MNFIFFTHKTTKKMERQRISTGSKFEKDVSFSRAVVVNKMVFVSGCTGYDYAKMTISEDIVAQTEQTFKNIEYALGQAGSSLKDVVRVQYIVPNAKDFEKCHATIRHYFGDIRPACTVICAKLLTKIIKIEIEVTAVKQ
jgi:enamine deaminase RidA (YjgF/YER057c/UK114 family)